MTLLADERPTVLLLGSLDTKGDEYRYVKSRLNQLGVAVILADFGILRDPVVTPDISAELLANRAGQSLLQLREAKDVHGARAEAIDTMASGAALLAEDLRSQGRISAIFGLGGGEGSTVISAAMRALPLGFPKLLVSTMTPTNVGAYFGNSDLTLMHSVTDIAGINRVSKRMLDNAAAMAAGMALFGTAEASTRIPGDQDGRPLVAISMFGTTTRGADEIRRLLDANGFESVAFHAVGSGGAAMEEMVRSGLVDAVIDLTPSEVTDELFGGVFSAGPRRLEAAAEAGIPQVIAPGALGQITFGASDTVPDRFKSDGRKILTHSPSVTIVRANAEESREIADAVADKILRSSGPVAVVLPLGGLSDYEQPGAPLADDEADQALFSTLHRRLDGRVPVLDRDEDINSPEFADLMVQQFLTLWRASGKQAADLVAPSIEKEST